MATILTPLRRGLDYANPFTAGLRLALPFGAAGLKNVTSDTSIPTIASASGAGMGPYGPTIQLAAGSDQGLQWNTAGWSPTNNTVAFVVTFDSSATSPQQVFSWGGSAGGDPLSGVLWYPGLSELRLLSSDAPYGAASIVPGVAYRMVIRRLGTVLSLYVNGALYVSISSASATSVVTPIAFGKSYDSANVSAGCTLSCVAAWARAISDVEIAILNADPAAPFRARKPLLYKSAGGGPISASCTATLSFGVTATGAVNINATAAPPLALGVTATGAVQVKATAAPALQFAVSATGTLTNNATGTAALQFAVSSAAKVNVNATASAALQLGVAATGAVAVQATGAATLNFSASATGTTSAGVHADCTATLALSASASATLSDNAVVSAALNLHAAGSAQVQNNAQAAAALIFGAQGTAQALVQASGAASLPLQASATSAVAVRATGAPVLSFVATATGTVVSLGAPVPLKPTRVYAGPLIRATRIYAGPLIRVTRVETFPS